MADALRRAAQELADEAIAHGVRVIDVVRSWLVDVDELTARFDDAELRELATRGLAQLVYDELEARRAAVPVVDDAEIERIHDLTLCDSSHCRTATGRYGRHASTAGLDPDARELELRSERAYWEKLHARESEIAADYRAKSAENLRIYRREVQLELLRSISLTGVNGVVTLDVATRADLEHMRAEAAGKAAAWGARSEWFADALVTLGDAENLAAAHGDLDALVERAEALWKGAKVRA